MPEQVKFSIIGGAGFRSQYFLRIAAALPDKFHVAGMVIRDRIQREQMEEKWQVRSYQSLKQLLEKEHPDFIVVSVPHPALGEYIMQLVEMDIPILAETPPAKDLETARLLYDMVSRKRARVQIAEQYHLQPMQAARLNVIHSGRLGRISEATVSVSHYYHAVSLIRKMLGISFEPATIRGMRFASPVWAGPDRKGAPQEKKEIKASREMAWIDFGEKLGIYDFTENQHRAWVRSNHLAVRGMKGEMFDHRLTVMDDYQTPLHLEFKRINKGEEENQEGHYLEGIMAGEKWVYRNPFAPARLYDDEIAIASCLEKMSAYINGGPEFYSLPEALQDHYLGLMIKQAVETGDSVVTSRQPWAE